MIFFLNNKINLTKVTHQQCCFAKTGFQWGLSKTKEQSQNTSTKSSLAFTPLMTSTNHLKGFHQNPSVPSEIVCKLLLRSCQSSSESLPALSPEKNSPTFCISHSAKKKKQPAGASPSTIISVAEIVQVNHTAEAQDYQE